MTRSPRDQSVTLQLIPQQGERLLGAALQDEVRVQSAVSNRLDTMMGQVLNIVTGMFEQMRAMVAHASALPIASATSRKRGNDPFAKIGRDFSTSNADCPGLWHVNTCRRSEHVTVVTRRDRDR
jgi:hypothetical protein